jgi:leucyl aminopeptidase
MNITVVSTIPEGVKVSLILDFQRNDLPEYLTDDIKNEMQQVEFSFKKGETYSYIHKYNGERTDTIFAGLGEQDKFEPETLRKAVAKAIRNAAGFKLISSICITRYPDLDSKQVLGRIIGEAVEMAMYKFDRLLSKKSESNLKDVYILDNSDEDLELGINEGLAIAKAVNFARDLVNEPANVLTPTELARRTYDTGIAHGLHVEIHNKEYIMANKMDAFWSVAKGATEEPKLIIMRYEGNPDSDRIFGLVGKGLTYDSGGYCIKTADGMVTMKADMGGSAAVIGAMLAISQLKPRINVTAVVAACENMISGDAYRTGDIIGSMAGKTIEVLNTDAEGRLTLVDAIHYIIEKEKVFGLLDIATLTGAQVVCLGTTASAVVTNDEALLEALEAASEHTGEKIWQLPNFEEYKELLKSEIADLKNVGGREAGTITAGMFIEEFVQGKPWLHVDMAGLALARKAVDYTPSGATGWGVRLITSLIENLEE